MMKIDSDDPSDDDRSSLLRVSIVGENCRGWDKTVG